MVERQERQARAKTGKSRKANGRRQVPSRLWLPDGGNGEVAAEQLSSTVLTSSPAKLAAEGWCCNCILVGDF